MKTFNNKQPVFLTASLLGLTLAATGYANAASNNPAPTKTSMQQDAKSAPMGDNQQRGGHNDKNDHDGKKMGGKEGMMQRQMEALNLTSTQKTQIEQLRSDNQAKMQQLQATLKQYDDNIDTQKKAGANTATLLDLYKQKQATMDQFFSLRQQQQQQFLNILTPEQQLKLFESRDEMHGDRGMGMKRSMGQQR